MRGDGEATREHEVPDAGADLEVALGELEPARVQHPALVQAPPELAACADVGRRQALRLDALASCAGAGRALVHVLLPRPGRTGVVLGRPGGGAELQLDAPTLSRRHCEVGRDGARWWVTDLDSSNGTFLEDRRLSAGVHTPLTSGDLLRLGKHRLVYLLPDALVELARRVAPAAPPPPASVATATLRLGPDGLAVRALSDMLASSGQMLAAFTTPFLLQVPMDEAPAQVPAAARVPAGPDDEADERGSTRPVDVEALRRLRRGRGLGGARVYSLSGARTIVGRAQECEVRLPADASASRRDAMIVPSAAGWGVIDLDSRNGTYVNGRRAPPGVVVPLKDEFQVWFGGYRAVFMSPAALERLLGGA